MTPEPVTRVRWIFHLIYGQFLEIIIFKMLHTSYRINESAGVWWNSDVFFTKISFWIWRHIPFESNLLHLKASAFILSVR